MCLFIGVTTTISQPLIGTLPLAGVSVAAKIGVENTRKDIFATQTTY
jgi:hypothetical protein